MEHLKSQPVPPYFLSYEVAETHAVAVSSSFGALTRSSDSGRRHLNTDLRTGDYKLDNTHPVGDGFPNYGDRYSVIEIPIDDDVDAIRAALWYHTDQKYKRAVDGRKNEHSRESGGRGSVG